MSANEVLSQFRALPPEERRVVALQIWEETELGEYVETPAFLAELRERTEDAHRNQEDSIPMEQVRAELREKFGWK